MSENEHTVVRRQPVSSHSMWIWALTKHTLDTIVSIVLHIIESYGNQRNHLGVKAEASRIEISFLCFLHHG